MNPGAKSPSKILALLSTKPGLLAKECAAVPQRWRAGLDLHQTHEGPVDVEITWLGAGKQMVKGLAAGKVHKVTFKATAG